MSHANPPVAIAAETVSTPEESMYVVDHREDGCDAVDDGAPGLYESADDAHAALSQMGGAQRAKRKVRRATAEECRDGRLLRPIAGSSRCLVEISEDIAARRYGVASKAQDEPTFLVEFARAFADMEPATTPAAIDARLRGLLPLVADLCCKYRGYKTESVHERRELLAGDLVLGPPPAVEVTT